MPFSTDYKDILNQIQNIDPKAYVRNRNFGDGAVTKLSPYISRGVISTKQIFDYLIAEKYNLFHIEKFVQELAWRDYWQQVWIEKGIAINQDLRHAQSDVVHQSMPKAIREGKTGIEVIDEAIKAFYETGYIHNHMRMYIAAMACNAARAHWQMPAKWMYYHLLDGDWASNALSWQWVAGSNANKKYVANQENINKYFYSMQRNSFLDVPYETIGSIEIPEVLKATEGLQLETKLPKANKIVIDPALPTLIYNYYNLDPLWHKDEQVNRVLLLEPSVFQKYPVSKKCIDFVLALAKNIDHIQLYVGEFQSLVDKYHLNEIIYKEHPLNHYHGTKDPRDWMFEVKGYYRSFFAFWKKCRKELNKYS